MWVFCSHIYFITKLGSDCLRMHSTKNIIISFYRVCKNIKNMKDMRTFYRATYSSGTCQIQKCIIFRWPWYHFTRISASNAIVTLSFWSNPGKEVGINHPRFCSAVVVYHCNFLNESFLNYLIMCHFVYFYIQLIKRYITKYDLVKLKST